MNPPSPRTRRREKRHLDIIEHATALLIQGGLDAFTLQSLAAALDLTPGALYRYFPSKDAILIAVQGHAVQTFDDAFQHAAQRAHHLQPDDPILAVVSINRAFIRITAEQPARFALIATTITDPRQLVVVDDATPILTPFLSLLQRTETPLLHAAHLGLLLPHPKPPLQRAIALNAALMGVLALRKVQRLSPELLDVDQLALNTLNTLLRGWGCPDELLQRAHQRLDATEHAP